MSLAFAAALVLSPATSANAQISEISPQTLPKLEQQLLQSGLNGEEMITVVIQVASSLSEAERFDEALALLEYFRAGFTQLFGPDHEWSLWYLQTNASILHASGDAEQTIPLYEYVAERQLTVIGIDKPSTILTLTELAQIYEDRSAFHRAAQLRSLAVEGMIRGMADRDGFILTALAGLKRVALLAGDQALADQTSKRIINRLDGLVRSGKKLPLDGVFTIAEAILRYGDSPEVPYLVPLLVNSLAGANNITGAQFEGMLSLRGQLAQSYLYLGREREALAILVEDVNLAAQHFGDRSLEMIEALAQYSTALTKAGRYDELVDVIERRLELSTALLGPDDPNTMDIYVEWLPVLIREGRSAEAVVVAHSVAENFERNLGANHPDTLAAKIAVASAVASAGDVAEAIQQYEALIPILTNVLGTGHPFTQAASRSYETLKLVSSSASSNASLARLETQLANSQTDRKSAEILDTIALTKYANRDFFGALDAARKSLAIKRDLVRFQSDSDSVDARAGLNLPHTLNLLQGAAIAARQNQRDLMAKRGETDYSLLSEAFEVAQLAAFDRSAEALSKASARGASNSNELATLLRQRDTLLESFRSSERSLISGFPENSATLSGQSDTAEFAALSAQIDEINSQITSIGGAGLLSVQDEPISFAELQQADGYLGPDDALILLNARIEDENLLPLIWVVTQNRIAVAELRDADSIANKISQFRSNLERDVEGSFALASRAPSSNRQLRTNASTMAPVELAEAFGLFQDIFGDPKISRALEGKSNWIIVPRGEFISLPFAALVDQRPAIAIAKTPHDLRATSWLGLNRTLTILPSVSALRYSKLRDSQKSAELAYFGIGDPSFAGQPAPFRSLDQARIASASNRVAAVRNLPRLSGTAQEVFSIASKYPQSSIVLTGARANEEQLFALDAKGTLGNANILHFATHGLLAGGLDGLQEAALALTPPLEAKAQNSFVADGLLTSSEIAQLDIDAEWVVLSACNTASSGQITGEGITGLARAFFYAGAQSVLATHWIIRDDVAARLISETVVSSQQESHGAALQRAIKSLVSDTSQDNSAYPFAHPSLWAPFVLIGK